MANFQSIFWAGFATLSLVATTQAQFHSQSSSSKAGNAVINQQAVNTAQRQAGLLSNNAGQAAVGAGAGLIMTEEMRRSFDPRHKLGLGISQNKNVDVWGRAIVHPDESYTESELDENTKTLEQRTKSKNGVLLQRRQIMLDQWGRPAEILIYDGRGTYKYRGIQIYDVQGRFSEEQIYDAKGTLLRRKVQEYGPDGKRMPLRSVDLVANVPPDLRLVITRESEKPGNRQHASTPQAEPEKRGWFAGNNRQADPPAPAPTTSMPPQPQLAQGSQPSATPVPAAAVPEKKRGLFSKGGLFRLNRKK